MTLGFLLALVVHRRDARDGDHEEDDEGDRP
jgi:hypothetical protein